MQEENFDDFERQNINVLKFTSEEQSQQGDQKIEKILVDQKDYENQMQFIEDQDDLKIKQTNNNNNPQNQEDDIDIIQFPQNRDMFFNDDQQQVDNQIPEQKQQQIIIQNTSAQYQSNINDRNIIPICQESLYQNQAQQLQIHYTPVQNSQNLPIIPPQQLYPPIQPTDQYDNKQYQEREEINKKKQKKNVQKQDSQNSDHYYNNVVVVPINKNEAQQHVVVNLGSNLSAYCCLGMLNRSDNCCQWICDLTIRCLTLPLIFFKKLILCIWDVCLEMCCQLWCPDCSQSCKTSCTLLSFNCVRCYNSIKRNSNVICTNICCCINCTVFSQQILACWDTFSHFCFSMCSSYWGLLLICCEFIFDNMIDCCSQICTFFCDCLQTFCEKCGDCMRPICDGCCEFLGICIKCIDCLR